MIYNFCTLFDKNYLSRGLSLLESLQDHLSDFVLHVLCLDDLVAAYFNEAQLSNVKVIELKDLKLKYPELEKAQTDRSIIEFYFTLSPILPLFILDNNPEVPFICSLDSDIYFFSSPKPIFEHLNNNSIIITPHKYSDVLKKANLEIYGIYNVSFQIFKNNEIGQACLKKWKDDCLEWCGDEFDEINQRYADQKYLDKWMNDFPGEVYTLNDPSSGLAVWNIDNYNFTIKDGTVMVNKNWPLIYYHFHHFKLLSSFTALNGFALYKVSNKSKVLLNNVYLQYWKKLNKYNSLLKLATTNSLRHNFKKGIFVSLILHVTGFIKVSNIIKATDSTIIIKIGRKLKWRI